MAMWDHYGPSKDDIRNAFNKAAADGQKYLLLLSESTNDEMLITTHDYTRPVADQSEIVPLLRALNEKCRSWGGDVRLSAVYDLSKDFDQASAMDKLSPQTQRELAAYGEEIRIHRAQREWDRKPWLERLFTNRPR